MVRLISEEKEFEDKGNYGHLCNILPTIAIDRVSSAESPFLAISRMENAG